MHHDQELIALVSSRICHDLISPIGAISNGVELLAMGGRTGGPELELIGESVTAAAHKLRCFRIAFGAADPGATLSVPEVVLAAEAMVTGRSSVVFAEVPGGNLPRVVAKALLLTLLCQERCLPLGGRSEVALAEDGFAIDTAAPRLRDMDHLWALTEAEPRSAKVIPAEVQYPLLGQLLRQHGRRLTRRLVDGGLQLELRGLRPAA